MNKFIYTLPVLIIALSSCSTAQKAYEVQPINVSVAPYLKMTCKELSTEQSSLLKEAESVGATVDSEQQSDKNMEIAAWVLFAPAAFFMDGNAESAAKLGSIKGQLEAVTDAMKVNECIN